MKLLYETDTRQVRLYTLEEYIEIPVYTDQRTIHNDRVETIVDYFMKEYEKTKTFPYLSLPLLVLSFYLR